MRTHRAYLFGVGLALPVLALVAGLQVPSVAASPQPAATDVNRTFKGDRLPSDRSVIGGKPADRQGWQSPQPAPKLPDGCEATVSAMTRSPLAQTPGRCIS
jgi:hypothetical protein